ncbi:hypothetical protein L3X38_016499 [Prunus dulcis]|uniref:Uncharacterized protein n=1 Tax=Prunus dulcis TaxID=3755 RepID=A0AAD4W5E3_PRUDU|nr:hypothetical protein L3X38_016499 [Prunus dulcis]
MQRKAQNFLGMLNSVENFIFHPYGVLPEEFKHPKNTRNGGPDVDPYRKAAPVTLDSLIISEATAGKEVLLKAAALALTAYVNVSDYLKEYVMEQFHCLALEVVRKRPGRQEEIPSALFRDGEEAKLLRHMAAEKFVEKDKKMVKPQLEIVSWKS